MIKDKIILLFTIILILADISIAWVIIYISGISLKDAFVWYIILGGLAFPVNIQQYKLYRSEYIKDHSNTEYK